MAIRPTIAFHGLPGTGKTTALMKVLAEKIENGVSPADITVTTFRKNLARDLQNRAAQLGIKTWFIGTTHSICYHLLGLERQMVMTPDDVRKVCSSLGIPYAVYLREDDDFSWPLENAPLGNTLEALRSYCIHNLLDPVEQWKEARALTPAQRSRLTDYIVRRWNEEYERYKEKNNKFDFDDMIKICVEEKISPNSEVLMEDEFQDKTPMQVELYEVWRADASSVYLSADPFQCIYSFFGTDPRFFEVEAERAEKRVVLPKSYRFGSDLWNFATSILQHGGYAPPQIETCGTTFVRKVGNGQFISSLFDHIQRNTFILCRTNRIAHSIGEILDSVGIPYFFREGGLSKKIMNLYDGVVKARKALSRADGIRIPDFNLSVNEAESLIDAFPASCFATTKKSIKTMGKKVEECISREFVSVVLSSNPFRHCLPSFFGSGANATAAKRRLERLWNRFGDKTLLNEVKIEISTIHGAKGREKDYVFLIDATSPVIIKQMHRREIFQEEHRVGFVGTTRARRGLYIVSGFGDGYPLLPCT